MSCSALIAYGIVYNKLVKHRNKYFNFMILLAIAAFIHGFYDFWLLNETVRGFVFLSIIILIIQISLFNSFINNTLNQSTFYSSDKTINNVPLQTYLFLALSSILLFEYVSISFKYSPSAGNYALLHSMFSGAFLLGFISFSLGKYKFVKGKWDKLHFWGVQEEIFIPFLKLINV